MNYSHLPFYLRNQRFNARIQHESSQKSPQESPFGSQLNQSVVLEVEDMPNRMHQQQNSQKGDDSNIADEHSQIIEAMSFASSSKHNSKKQIENFTNHIVHYYQRGYRREKQTDYVLGQNNYRYQDHSQTSKKSTNQQQLKLHLSQIIKMTQNLKVIHKTVLMEMSMCRGDGNFPIFLRNQQMHAKIITELKKIIAQQIEINVQNKLHKHYENLSKLFKTIQEKGLLEKCTYQSLDDEKGIQTKIYKIIQKLQKSSIQSLSLQKQISSLKENLQKAQAQCDKTSSVLYRKLQQIIQLKQQISNQKKQPPIKNALPPPLPPTIPQFQNLLQQKDLSLSHMSTQIQHLTQRNNQLMDDKQKLQEQIFTLEQKIIGVEMEIEQRVREGIQEMRSAIQKQLQNQFKIEQDQKQKQILGNNQFFLQTIDTLSQQIKDLTQKCKYYQNYIRQQEKNHLNQIPRASLQQQQQYSRDFEQVITKRLQELQLRENTLLNIENQLTIKDRKLKELENKLVKEANHFQKRQKEFSQKQQEIQKYLKELNTREEELYVWEKQLCERDEKLAIPIAKKHSELERGKYLGEKEIVSSGSILNPYSMMAGNQGRNIRNPNNLLTYSNQTFFNNQAVLFQQPSILRNPKAILHQRPYSQHQSSSAIYQQPSQLNHHLSKRQFPKHKTKQQKFYHHHNMSYENIRYLDHNNNNNNRSDLDIGEVRQQQQQKRSNYKFHTQESMRVNSGYFDNLDGQQQQQNFILNSSNSSKMPHQNYRRQAEKLYLSSTYDNRSQIVEEILANRRKQHQNQNRYQREEYNKSPQPINHNRNPLNDLFKKSQVRKIKSPLKNDQSFHTLKQVTQRKLKQRFQKKIYQKPAKDISDISRSISNKNILVSPSNSLLLTSPKRYYPHKEKSYGYEVLRQNEKQFTPRSFMKQSIPLVHNNISEKLQKLKEEIKREVRDLE